MYKAIMRMCADSYIQYIVMNYIREVPIMTNPCRYNIDATIVFLNYD